MCRFNVLCFTAVAILSGVSFAEKVILMEDYDPEKVWAGSGERLDSTVAFFKYASPRQATAPSYTLDAVKWQNI